MSDATNIRAIQDLIQKMAGTYNRDIVSIIMCTVDSVDGFTCDCTPISGEADTSIPGVKLNAEANDGFLIVPKVGSTVLVATSSRNDYFVFMYSDIDKVICVIDGSNSYEFSSAGFIWNGGNLGGMIKIDPMVQKVNNLENLVNALIALYNSHTHVIPALSLAVPITGPTAPGVTAPTTSTEATVLTPTQKVEIEDTKIKH